MPENQRRRRPGTLPATLCLLSLLTLLLPGVLAQDGDNDGVSDSTEESLAQQFAPVLYFTSDETVYPVAIQYHLERSNLNQSRDGDDLVDSDPTVAEIGAINDRDGKYYLDNREGGLDDENIERDYAAQNPGYTIYARVVRDSGSGGGNGSGGYLVVQYWLFYAFNRGPLNIHEGDWEMVQLVLDENNMPVTVMYSQHGGGQKADWSQVEREGNHPKVFVARGTHANYFRSYQGKMGLANDEVGDDGKVLKATEYELVMLGEAGDGNHPADQDWLDYAGHWGDYGNIDDELQGRRGPYGPAFRENGTIWGQPVAWGEDLSQLNDQLLTLEWLLANLVTYLMTIFGLLLVIKLLIIYRRHRKTGLGPRIWSMLYIDGLNGHSLANLLALGGLVLACYSLFTPWYGVYVDIEAGEYTTDGEVQVLDIDGGDGVTINRLESNGGLVQLVGFPLPFALLLSIGLVFLVLATVGLQKGRKLGRKYIMGGIKLLIPIVLILVIISQATSMAEDSPAELPDEAADVLGHVSDSPEGGEDEFAIEEYGQVKLRWGLEEGGKLVALSGLLFLAAGILLQITGGKLFEGKKERKKRELRETRELREGEAAGVYSD